MTEIRPFSGVSYNPALVRDLSSVISPPYDVITPAEQEELYRRSEYNFVRIEYGRELPQDTATDNKYTRGLRTLNEWLSKGVLEVARTPAIYLHSHYFVLQGKGYRRREITAAVRLYEWEKRVVRPHEGTLSTAKADRIAVLRTLKANTSPILALYADDERSTSPILEAESQKKPLISTGELNCESHKVWAVTDEVVIQKVSEAFLEKPLYIADGHHRYESALNYGREQTATTRVSGDEPFNFVMMTLVDFSDPGLVILSPHRLLRGVSKSLLSEARERFLAFFELETLPLNTPDVWGRTDSLQLAAEPVPLVAFGLEGESLTILRPKRETRLDALTPYFHSDIYKQLDVSIIDHVILGDILGVDAASNNLDYSYDRLDAVERVRDGEYQLAFLLGPVKKETIKAIADASDRMPRKSTYFYPKAPAGLISRLIR